MLPLLDAFRTGALRAGAVSVRARLSGDVWAAAQGAMLARCAEATARPSKTPGRAVAVMGGCP
ncbi:MAG TPA: hypothetical protein VK820_00720 [Steroidobacteraceae bacterium]|nr:hypothetical protein [Steroidobacteraceae bacterium]